MRETRPNPGELRCREREMSEIILVRHGEASADFRESTNPGLSDLGRRQALEVAARLSHLKGFELFTSPLKRAQETAEPLSGTWGKPAAIETRVREIPSEGIALADRGEWLSRIVSGRWSQVDGEQSRWRDALLQCLLQANTPRIYFSHFIAINVVVGAITEDDRVVCVFPKNTAVFRFANEDGELSIVELGEQFEPVRS